MRMSSGLRQRGAARGRSKVGFTRRRRASEFPCAWLPTAPLRVAAPTAARTPGLRVAVAAQRAPRQPLVLALIALLAFAALCVREVGRDLFILACKTGDDTTQVEFSGLPATAGVGEVLYEPPRTVKAADGRFRDWFAPYDVHVYRFRLS
jgi:hypothetical protein